MTRRHRWLALLAGASVVALCAAIFVVLAGREPTITAEGNDWVPSTLTVASQAEIVVRNTDLVVHTFVIEELEIDANVTPGRDRTIRIDAGPGRYRFICDVTGHTGMTGTIEVTP